jgi:hypothetical protein
LILPGRAYAPDVEEWEPSKLRQRGDGARREGRGSRHSTTLWSCGGARWERRGSRRCCEAAPACGGLPSPSARVARAAGEGSTSDAEARRDEEHELKAPSKVGLEAPNLIHDDDGARRHELTSSCRGLPPWLYLSGVLEVPLKVHVRAGICPMLKGRCLHALYVSSVHVSDQHQNKYKY